MKELTIEQKAQRYDEAIEIAKKINNEQQAQPFNIMTRVFPELKESEDEKIRKAIIEFFELQDDNTTYSLIPKKDILAWLEKQGKREWSKEMGSLCLEACSLLRAYSEGVPSNSSLAQKIKRAEAFLGDLYHEEFFPNTYNPRPDIISPEWSDKDETIIKTMCNEGNLKPSEIRWLNNLCYRVKQQKPADKTEPKFHEDQWITNGDYTWEIVEVMPLDYILQSQDGNTVEDTISHVDEQFHSFTIKDAKDGDVLCDYCEEYDNPLIFILKKFERVNFGLVKPSDYSSYCFLTAGDRQMFKEGTYHHEHNIKPATKEQRDTLEKAITNAGYRWDKEKLKLEKV